MKNKGGKGTSKNMLSIEKPEVKLVKHPSAKGLCDENGEILTPSNTIKNEILQFKIDSNDNYILNSLNSSNNNELLHHKEKNEGIKDEGNSKKSFFIQINTCDYKKIDEKESFYVEVPKVNCNKDNNINNFINSVSINSNNTKNKTNLLNININPQPLFYGFDSAQYNFDKEITNSISKGEDYKVIENKFLTALKKPK